MCFFCGTAGEAQEGLRTKPGITESILDTIVRYASTYPNQTQFSIAIIRNDTVSYIGVLKSDGRLIQVSNEDSVFEIGSITKVFTSTVFVDYIMSQGIDPDEPISRALPFRLSQSEQDGKAITYKMLSNHTSGIPSMPDSIDSYIKRNPENPFVEFGPKEFEHFFTAEMRLHFSPGTQWEYSNMGAALLGFLLELRTGKALETLFQSKVFSKYGMNSTSMERSHLQDRLVHGHDEAGNPVSNWDWNAFRNAGGCLSTARDLTRFVLANFSNDPVLQYQRQRTFRVEHNDIDIAYAWHVFRKNGVEWYFHNGGTGGYHSNVTMDLARRRAVVVLANCTYEPEERYLEKVSWKILKAIQ
jgi:CubicO group peptidase (beta-lactamase class C family)